MNAGFCHILGWPRRLLLAMLAPTRSAPTAGVIAAFAALYVIWGTTYLATRIAVESIPPFLMRGLACTAAGAILCVVTGRRAACPSLGEWVNAAIIGILLFVGCQGVQAAVQLHVASGLVAVVAATLSLWVPLVAWVSGGSPPSRNALVGQVAGITGVVLLVTERQGSHDRLSLAAASILLLSTLSWAVGSVLSTRLRRPSSPWFASGMSLLAGGIALLLLSAVLGEAQTLRAADIPFRAWLAVAYHIGANYILCFSCYVWLLGAVSPAKVASYAYVNPLIAILVGWLMANELITAHILAGTVLIVAAVGTTISGDALFRRRSIQTDGPSSAPRRDHPISPMR
jgi:drug/metabolite transporter (DMT)-like permease